MGWIGRLVIPILKKRNEETIEKNYEYYGSKRAGKVPHCNFYLMALLVCNSHIACPIDYATLRYQIY